MRNAEYKWIDLAGCPYIKLEEGKGDGDAIV